MTQASTGVLIAKRGKANGRVLTHRVRLLSGQGGRALIPISVKTVARALFRDRLFKRIGNTFASTQTSHPKGFRITGGNALFLSRVKGLSCRLRTGLLATLRHHDVIHMKDGAPVPIGVHLVYTAGHSLRRVMRGKSFHRSLLCHVGAVRIRVPPLERQPRSVMPLARVFLSGCAGVCKGATVYLDLSTGRGLGTRP